MIAVGAILAFALDVHTNVVSIYAVGWILIGVGVVGLMFSLIVPQFWVRHERVGPPDRVYTDETWAHR